MNVLSERARSKSMDRGAYEVVGVNVSQKAPKGLHQKSTSSYIQGPIANILPVLGNDGCENDEGYQSDGLGYTSSEDRSNLINSKKGLLDNKDGIKDSKGSLRSIANSFKAGFQDSIKSGGDVSMIELSKLKKDDLDSIKVGMRTPGQIRTAVLEWMYEENNSAPCSDLNVDNLGILEDLVNVFVCVVLHGKSDIIRSKVWRFLMDGSIVSLHFGVLVICNLNASNHESEESIEEDENSLEHKGKRVKDLAVIEKAILTLKHDSLKTLNASQSGGENSLNPETDKIRKSIMHVLEQLEGVHDNQVLTNIDLNLMGRTSRQNIDILVSKVRNALVKHHTEEEGERLGDLDGKLGFIKTLTDLDEWLRQNISRENRRDVLLGKLESLSVALPHGAYFPTAVNDATESHRVLRLVVEETIVFNTAQKCPFLLVAEIEPIQSEELELPKSSAVQFSRKQRIHYQRRSSAESSDLGFETEDEYIDDDPKNVNETDVHAMEKWEDMQERIRKNSPFGDRPNWKLASMFVKSGDDLKQQQLGILFVSTFKKIFLEEGVPVWLSPYKVIPTGQISGLLEPARNSDSIARIKERGNYNGIDEYFIRKYGPKDSRTYKRAQKNFMCSLAGYSIVAYLIKLHDRHNGNILLDLDGHVLHIDYGFMLGYSHKFERSPFKLTEDMVKILDGPRSPTFQKFRRLMEKAYIAANKHERELVLLAELMSVDDSSSACFQGGRRWVIDEFRARFNKGLSTRKLRAHINDIIDYSMVNYTTWMYDRFQRCVNGIY